MRPRFALLGAAGYVAPKHMQAIKDVGGDLVAICDPSDSVGVVDQFFPSARYFREPEVMDRHLSRLARSDRPVDYVAICTPNYLHDAHCRMAMRVGADAICEKPLTLEPRNLDALLDIESDTGQKVHPVLQLRHSQTLVDLRRGIEGEGGRYHLVVEYHTHRGPWYDRSWKGDPAKSGGRITNIGIHVLDLVLWLLGPAGGVLENVFINGHHRISLSCKRGIADITLSTGYGPDSSRAWRRLALYRSDKVLGQLALVSDVDMADFGSLHTAAYRSILAGNGLRLNDARPAVALASRLRK